MPMPSSDAWRSWFRSSVVWLPILIALVSLIIIVARYYEINAWDAELERSAGELRRDMDRLEASSKRDQIQTYEDITEQQNAVNTKLTHLIETLRRRIKGQELASQISDMTHAINEIVRQQRALPESQQWQLDELLRVRRQELSALIDRKFTIARPPEFYEGHVENP